MFFEYGHPTTAEKDSFLEVCHNLGHIWLDLKISEFQRICF